MVEDYINALLCYLFAFPYLFARLIFIVSPFVLFLCVHDTFVFLGSFLCRCLDRSISVFDCFACHWWYFFCHALLLFLYSFLPPLVFFFAVLCFLCCSFVFICVSLRLCDLLRYFYLPLVSVLVVS